MTLTARGSLSEALLHALRGTSADRTDLLAVTEDDHEDAQLSLWMLYELHYAGLDAVEDALEWDPDLLRLRRRLESDLEQRLRGRFPGHRHEGEFTDALFDYIDAYDGPALAPYVQRSADEEQAQQMLKHRSLYHLKEFDPTAWVVPRLGTVPKAALIELAYDEYGVGDPDRLHAHLFARGMAACGLDPSRGAYVDEAPVEILEQNNAMSLLGLHRRLRAAALGHLAAFEATSSAPSRRLALGLQRLGFDDRMVGYYTEHVTADAVHDQLACRGVCGSFVKEEPGQAEEVFFGAFTCLDLEARYAARMLEDWQGPTQKVTA